MTFGQFAAFRIASGAMPQATVEIGLRPMHHDWLGPAIVVGPRWLSATLLPRRLSRWEPIERSGYDRGMRILYVMRRVVGSLCVMFSGLIIGIVVVSTMEYPEKGIPRSPKLLLFGLALLGLSYFLLRRPRD